MQTNDELKERLALLQAIKALEDEIADEDQIKEAADYLATLQAIAEHDAPNEDDMKDAADHLATLRAIDEHEAEAA